MDAGVFCDNRVSADLRPSIDDGAVSDHRTAEN